MATVQRRTGQLGPREVSEVGALARAASDADGTNPLSEHVMLHLRHGEAEPAVHLFTRDAVGTLAGYAHVDATDQVTGPSAELVVHPAYRRRGLGRALVLAAIEESRTVDPAGRLRLWAHGDHPSASALAHSLGFDRYRVLLQLRRSLYAEVPAPEVPGGIAIRTFRPGADDVAWLAVNNHAFADHPDQGGWTLDDLRVRQGEPWFSAGGFFLAEAVAAPWIQKVASRGPDEGGRLLGFHWTKVHGDGPEPIGEVYVLGVDPVAQGAGLAAPLTLAGLRHLRGLGLGQVMLYVDESNARAVALYRKLGFAHWSTDVGFRRRTR